MNNKFKKLLYAANLLDIENRLSKELLVDRELGCTVVDKGIVSPLRKTNISSVDTIYEGGVSDKDFNFIAGHKRNDNNRYNNYEAIRSYESTNLEYQDETVLYAGIAFSHFGHFLIESLSRLWWVVKNNGSNTKIVFVKNRAFDVPFAFYELLRLIGIEKENIIFLKSPTQFKQIIVPEQSFWFASFYYKEFKAPYKKILEKITPGQYSKVYLSRTRFEKKDFVNEEYFEDFYKNKGYEIVYPETLSINEQISIISGANEIVSTIGTISHLAIFAKKGTKVITLLRSRRSVNAAQLMINQAMELDYTYIDVTCNFLPTRYSTNCFYIGPNLNWKEFVTKEYGSNLNINMFDYLNSDNSHIGEYLELWLKTYSKQSEVNKIKNDSTLDLLKNLELVFAEDSDLYVSKSEQLIGELIEKPNPASKFINKIFDFSRYDGNYSRQIKLSDNGVIETITGKHNKNESFWLEDGKNLNFMNYDGRITSSFFCTTYKEGGLFLLGYYEPNREIIFKLREIKATGIRLKKN